MKKNSNKGPGPEIWAVGGGKGGVGKSVICTLLASWLARMGHRIENLKIVAELGSTEAVRQGIKNNLGISILSTLAVSEELENGSLKAVAVEDLDLTRSFYLTRHRYRSLSPLNRIFMEFLKKELKDYPTTNLKGLTL